MRNTGRHFMILYGKHINWVLCHMVAVKCLTVFHFGEVYIFVSLCSLNFLLITLHVFEMNDLDICSLFLYWQTEIREDHDSGGLFYLFIIESAD